jgi:hypothetical protein
MKSKRNQPDALAAWLTDPRSADYFGHGFTLKVDVLAALIRGDETLTSVAARHGVTKEAACKQARRARATFGQLLVDSHRKKNTHHDRKRNQNTLRNTAAG